MRWMPVGGAYGAMVYNYSPMCCCGGGSYANVSNKHIFSNFVRHVLLFY